MQRVASEEFFRGSFNVEEDQLLAQKRGPVALSAAQTARLRAAFIYVGFVLSAIYMMVVLLTLHQHPYSNFQVGELQDGKIELVETVPDVLVSARATRTHRETYQAWLDVIEAAEERVDIAAYYSTMFCTDINPTDPERRCKDYAAKVVDALGNAASRGVEIYMVTDAEGFGDFSDFERYKELFGERLHLSFVNFKHLFGGVQHAKIVASDRRRFYLGSANLDWRALTEVKEIGVYVTDATLAGEVYAMLEQFYTLSTTDKTELVEFDDLADKVRQIYNKFNAENQIRAVSGASYYFAESPARMNAVTRAWDADALVSVIESAEKTVDVQAMDYVPALIYQSPMVYWGKLEDALRAAAFRGVRVRLMIQKTDEFADLFASLATVDGVSVYFMEMPSI